VNEKLGYCWQTARRICATCNDVADPKAGPSSQ